MWLKSNDLGDLLRQAFIDQKAERVRRCIRYMGVWYAYL